MVSGGAPQMLRVGHGAFLTPYRRQLLSFARSGIVVAWS
jgi:hypothetical protein